MSSPGLWVLALLRWLMFAGLAAALGGVAARGLARRPGGPAPAPLPGPWALRASLLGLVASAGVVTVLVLVPVGSLLTTSYGRVLIVKAALVTAAACLALPGRMWLRREPGPGAGPALATKLEIGTPAVVLAVTALLSGLNPPRAPIRPLGYQDRTSQR